MAVVVLTSSAITCYNSGGNEANPNRRNQSIKQKQPVCFAMFWFQRLSLLNGVCKVVTDH